jgi:hypothetical protein
VVAACEETVQVVDAMEPRPDEAALYDRLYPEYQALYPRLRPTFRAIADIGLA